MKTQMFIDAAVRSDTDDCVLWPYNVNSGGYPKVKREGKSVFVTRIVLTRTQGEPEPGAVARHTCHNTRCVNPKHLKWGTQQENIQDKRDNGTYQEGVRHHKHKLNDDIVREIRNSKDGDRALAKKYGVTPATIYGARVGRTWSHVSNKE